MNNPASATGRIVTTGTPMKRSITPLSLTKQDSLRLWYFASVTLTMVMVLKEAPVSASSGGRLAFHWSYDAVLFLAVISTLVASTQTRSRLLAFLGCLVAIVGAGFLARPQY